MQGPNPAVAVGLVASLLSCGPLLATLASAQDIERRQFNIPAEDAADALREFARQSGGQMLFPFGAVAGRRTSAAVGTFTDDEALKKLLEGSGVAVTSRTGTTITVGTQVAEREPPGADPFAVRPLEEVIVTASKRPQAVIDVPISMTVFTQNALNELGAVATEDVARHTPGLSFSSNGTNSGVYSIRGVSTGSAAGNTQSPVAIYIDDFSLLDPFYPKITTNLRLFDLDRVEILRGPQGTLFGSGALGGAIRLVTNKPKVNVWAGDVEATFSDTRYGGFNYLFDAMANIPIVSDKVALRLVGSEQIQSGYIQNTQRNKTDANRATSAGARIEIRLVPTDNLTLTASFLYEDDHPEDSEYTAYDASSLVYPGKVPNAFLNINKIYNLTGEYALDRLKLTSITNYSDRYESAQVDFSQSAEHILGINAPSTIVDAGPSRTLSHEMRLASSDDSPFQWLFGGIYQRNFRTIYESIEVDGAGAIYAPLGYPSDRVFFSDTLRKTVETAAFGEASYILNRFTLTAGLRVVRNWLDRTDNAEGLLNNGLPRLYTSLKEFANTPRFAAAYKINPTAMVYVQASKGYRVGQANTGLSADPASGQPIPRSYAPDTLWNYELGAKASFLDKSLTVNGAVYDIEWKGVQLTQLSNPDGINFINNAGNARIRGAELELVARPASWLELGTELTFTDAKLTQIDPGVPGKVGDRLPASPRFMASTYGRLDFLLFDQFAGYLRLDHQYVGREYATLDNATSLTYGNYNLWSTRAAIDLPSVEVAVFVTNLLDTRGVVSALNVSAIPVGIPLQPRTVGFTARARF